MTSNGIESKIRTTLSQLSGHTSQAATRSEVGELGSYLLELAQEVTRLRIELEDVKARGPEPWTG